MKVLHSFFVVKAIIVVALGVVNFIKSTDSTSDLFIRFMVVHYDNLLGGQFWAMGRLNLLGGQIDLLVGKCPPN